MKEQAVTLTHNAIKRITHVAQREGSWCGGAAD